jgi:hypothetical protein
MKSARENAFMACAAFSVEHFPLSLLTIVWLEPQALPATTVRHLQNVKKSLS